LRILAGREAGDQESSGIVGRQYQDGRALSAQRRVNRHVVLNLGSTSAQPTDYRFGSVIIKGDPTHHGKLRDRPRE
jgi:hypothetical protein